MDSATWRPHIVSRLSCQASGGSEQSPPTNALILKSRCLNHRITAKRFSPITAIVDVDTSAGGEKALSLLAPEPEHVAAQPATPDRPMIHPLFQ
jgi:hypothetical protein